MTSTIEGLKSHPNLLFAMKATEQILKIETPIKYLLLVINLNNETCGTQLISKSNVKIELTEQEKINILLGVMAEFNVDWYTDSDGFTNGFGAFYTSVTGECKISFKMLKKYGNLIPKMIHRKMKENQI